MIIDEANSKIHLKVNVVTIDVFCYTLYEMNDVFSNVILFYTCLI